jgi:hypothetical protein
MRQPLAVIVVAVVCAALPASALIGCLADSRDNATTHMACCKTVQPDCGTASKSKMECCKTGSHPDQQNVVKTTAIYKPLTSPALVWHASSVGEVPSAVGVQSSGPPMPIFAGTTSPPHLIASALLI